MVRISDRLRTVAHMCEKGAVVADIGTDHGYLPIYLVQEGIAPSAIAMDLRKGPLDKAKKHICDNCLEDRIQTRLSDGLEKLSANEADIITICGMGGRLIADIVTKGMNVITQNTTLIVSPQSEVLENKDKTLYEYLIKEKETNDGISNSLKKDESNPTVKLRLQQLSQKNNIIMDALSYYD